MKLAQLLPSKDDKGCLEFLEAEEEAERIYQNKRDGGWGWLR